MKTLKEVKMKPLIDSELKNMRYQYLKTKNSEKSLQINCEKFLVALERKNKWELENMRIEQ